MDAIALPDSQMQSQLCEFQTETQDLGLDFPKSETRFWQGHLSLQSLLLRILDAPILQNWLGLSSRLHWEELTALFQIS